MTTKEKPKGGLGKGLDVLFGGSTSNIEPESQSNITELNPKPDDSILFIDRKSTRLNSSH